MQERILEQQQKFYQRGKTREYAFRMKALNRLQEVIKRREAQIHQALAMDLNKSSVEAYMSETGFVLHEISYQKQHLASWMREKRVATPLAQFPAKSFEVAEPYGSVLILSPWNYPFQLAVGPLAGAIAAGNCCVVKPSAYAPATAQIIADILGEIFPAQYVAVIQGGRDANTYLLEQKFDYIFFTGSPQVGRIVMAKAAANLTPVTLELGGKSPCIVDESADLELAAKRIVFGKYLNSGQTCVAPDYLLVQESVKSTMLHYMDKWIRRMYGSNPLENPDYPRMINEKHYDRVMNLIKGESVVTGGRANRETLQIAPTVLDDITVDAPVMQEEIFGPVLPVLTYDKIENAIAIVSTYPKPLALYLFTNQKWVERMILREVSFGGGCINDTVIHLATSAMGFGGVGESGMGSYHGKCSFDTFSHKKSIVKKYNWLDLPMRYHPYTGWKEAFIRLFLR